LPEVAKTLNVSPQTIRGWFEKHRADVMLPTRVCGYCGKSLNGMNYTANKKYCSLCASRANYWKKHTIPKHIKYDCEFLEKALEMYCGGLEGRDISRILNIPEGTVYCWINKYGQSQERLPSPELLELLSVSLRLEVEKDSVKWKQILRQNASKGDNLPVHLVCQTVRGDVAGDYLAAIVLDIMENVLNTIENPDLLTQNLELNKRIGELENTVAELSALVKHFQELFKISQHKKFGASSEKTDINQLTLFDIYGNAPVKTPPEEPETEEISYKRRKQKGKRETDLSKLPLEVVVHEIPENERKCPECGETMNEFGADTRDEIKIIPAKVIHVQHKSKVYKCERCSDFSHKTPIVKAPMPESVIKGSAASASAVAFIITQKYLMHLPFYRLERIFAYRRLQSLPKT